MIKYSFFKKIGAIVAFLAIALGGVAIFNNHTEKALSATIPLPVASFETSLSSGITATDTTMTLVSITTDDAVTLTNGSTYGFVIDEGSANEEYVLGTINTADNTVTGMTRGISTLTGNTSITTLKKIHRRGASVKITDHPVLTVLARVVNGTETLPNALTYASGVGPVNSGDIADKEYVLSVVSGGSVTFEKVVVAGTAGETIAAGNIVYLKASDGFWWKADADDTATIDTVQLAVAQGSGTAGNAITGGVLLRGLDSNNTGTAGSSVYVSNTAGGVSTSAGTNARIIGQYKPTSGGLYFNPEYSQTLTVGQKAAAVGSQGVLSSTNKYITQDNVSDALLDQSQTTSNATIEFGEADATGRKNQVAQSFIPTFTKMRSVSIYKAANTGTFTGTVTVSLQADSAGSPSGSALASKVFTNAEWESTAVGAVEAVFSSEYTSVTAGSLYWIVIQASTSNTSNHPNLGTNSAGGYGSGSVKYKNSTDGHVAVSTIDLYFISYKGMNAQIVKTNSSGKIENNFFTPSEMPIPAFFQTLSTGLGETISSNVGSSFGSNQDGSVIYVMVEDDINGVLFRYERDSLSGSYFLTHSVNPTLNVPQDDSGAMIVIGSYMYLFTNNGINMVCSRFLASDLTGETSMTVPTVSNTTNTSAWTDGVSAYVLSDASDTTLRKWTLSGTTFTAASTSSVTADIFDRPNASSMFDGTNTYYASWTSDTISIHKLTSIDGTAYTTTTKKYFGYSDADTGLFIFSVDSSRMYVGRAYSIYDEVAITNSHISIFPITKP